MDIQQVGHARYIQNIDTALKIKNTESQVYTEHRHNTNKLILSLRYIDTLKSMSLLLQTSQPTLLWSTIIREHVSSELLTNWGVVSLSLSRQLPPYPLLQLTVVHTSLQVLRWNRTKTKSATHKPVVQMRGKRVLLVPRYLQSYM